MKMKMKFNGALLKIIILFIAFNAYGKTQVIEGPEATALYNKNNNQFQVLAQKDKIFIYRHKNNEIIRPEEITVKVGEVFFIINEEEKFIHNVYDMDDDSWILKKQEPGGIAAVSFTKEGRHALRCAIHPTMKTLIKVIKE